MTQDFETIDSLVGRVESPAVKIAEDEMIRLYGDRYIKYRKDWGDASEFLYEPDFPIYIMLEQSFKCNYKCPSCVHGYKDKRDSVSLLTKKSMPWDLFERVILEGEEHNCPSLAVHNNDEPLLIKDLAKRIAFAKEHGFMDVIMTTNGVLFTEEKIREVIDAGVTKICFSVDALTEETYNIVRPTVSKGGEKKYGIKKLFWAVEYALNYKEKKNLKLPMIRASYCVTSNNEHEIVPFIEKYSDLFDYIDIQPFCTYDDPKTEELVPKCASKVDNYHCAAFWKYSIVRGDGDVLPCPNFWGAEVVMGNIYKNTLYDIFNSEAAKKMRSDYSKGIYTNPICQKCANGVYTIVGDIEKKQSETVSRIDKIRTIDANDSSFDIIGQKS